MNCYRFRDREHFRALAAAEGLLDPSGNLITCTHDYALDEVGVLTRGGAWDPETGEVLEPSTALEGWHVNTIGLAPEAWDPFLVVVNHPARVFAGGPTQAPPTEILEEIAAT